MAYEPLMRPGLPPEQAPGHVIPPFGHRVEHLMGIAVERDAPLVLRDRVEIYADVYRASEAATDLPVILSWSPYGKHRTSNQVFWPPSGVNPEWLSPLTPFEGPDPLDWCPRGYAVVVVDPRGMWRSGGDYHHNSPVEQADVAEVIGLLADMPWANGNVGMTGVSYLAAIQYYAAAAHPPALKAINPWEGFSDWYREFGTHGGIPETGFAPRASDNIRFGPSQTEDTWGQMQAHPLHDEYWQSKDIDLAAIECPAWVVASWSDQGLHTRGTLEAFKQMSSRQKWLTIHGQKKWAHYYLAESTRKRHEFFDHFLLGRETALPAWPKVEFEARRSYGDAVTRTAADWPIAGTEAAALYLAPGKLGPEPDTVETVTYDSADGEAHFDIRFDQETEITGHAAVELWFESLESDDADLFVSLEKLDREGNPVGMAFYAFYEDGPMALGWLRASHRAEAANSSLLQPIHPHDREEPLSRGEPTLLRIEIWPSSTLFAPGEGLRLVVAGRDIRRDALPNLPFARHENLRNVGRHMIHTGGAHASRLLLPMIPPEGPTNDRG